jgi:hypothetical protein
VTSNNPPGDDERTDDDFPTSSAAGSLLHRFRPPDPGGDPPSTPPGAEPGNEASEAEASPFTVEDLASVDLAHIDSEQTGPMVNDPRSALKRLTDRMARTKQELAAGRINQAQFQAVYTHYAEQKALILRLLDRGQRTGVLQRAVTAGMGHTGFLRRHHEARPIGLAVFDNQTGMQIEVLELFEVPRSLIAPLLSHLGEVENAPGPEGDAHFTQIAGGHWLAYVGGDRATTLAVFSAEPSARQLTRQVALHAAFERENADLLRMGFLDPDTLTFPQADLFEG